IDVTLPPRQVMVYDLRLVEAHDPLHTRADLAIAPRDVERDGDIWRVVVHNIGAAAAHASVALVDDAGNVLASSDMIALEAPLDLVPRTVTVTLPHVVGATAVVVNPSQAVPEITQLNNRVQLP